MFRCHPTHLHEAMLGKCLHVITLRICAIAPKTRYGIMRIYINMIIYVCKLWSLHIWKTLSFHLKKTPQDAFLLGLGCVWAQIGEDSHSLPVHPLSRTEVMLVWVMEVEVSWWRVGPTVALHVGLEEWPGTLVHYTSPWTHLRCVVWEPFVIDFWQVLENIM